MSRFTGRVALVTGAARGIGLGIAERLATEGAAVGLFDLDDTAAREAAQQISDRHGVPTTAAACDVSDTEAVESAVAQCVQELGGLHVLVNNAGILRDNLLFKMSDEDWDLVMKVHLRGPFLMSRAAQRHLVAQRYGKIVNISSVSALGARGQANYSAAKMGVQGFTRTLAMELGPFGINVNAVAPGYVVTEMTDSMARRLQLSPEELRESSAAVQPIRRVGHPEDIAAAVAFLASEEGSYITGQTLYVDGGRTLG